MITLYLQQVARFATVEVAGQTKVAGRDAYQLRMTPVATDTALGYVQAAVDGETMLPLQLEVYAKGGTTPVLQFGFTSVSYDAIDPATFAFTPPEGAKVTTKTVDGDELAPRDAAGARGATPARSRPTAQKDGRREGRAAARCSRASRSQKLVPYELAWARDYTARPFQWGYVLEPGRPAHRVRRAAHGGCWAPPPAWTSTPWSTTGLALAARRRRDDRPEQRRCSTATGFGTIVAGADQDHRRAGEAARSRPQQDLADPRHDHRRRRQGR